MVAPRRGHGAFAAQPQPSRSLLLFSLACSYPLRDSVRLSALSVLRSSVTVAGLLACHCSLSLPVAVAAGPSCQCLSSLRPVIVDSGVPSSPPPSTAVVVALITQRTTATERREPQPLSRSERRASALHDARRTAALCTLQTTETSRSAPRRTTTHQKSIDCCGLSLSSAALLDRAPRHPPLLRIRRGPLRLGAAVKHESSARRASIVGSFEWATARRSARHATTAVQRHNRH